jgi:hypothetical protein
MGAALGRLTSARSPFQAREAWPFPATPCRPSPVGARPLGAMGRRSIHPNANEKLASTWKEVDASPLTACRPFSFPSTGGVAVSSHTLSPNVHRLALPPGPLGRRRDTLFNYRLLYTISPEEARGRIGDCPHIDCVILSDRKEHCDWRESRNLYTEATLAIAGRDSSTRCARSE